MNPVRQARRVVGQARIDLRDQRTALRMRRRLRAWRRSWSEVPALPPMDTSTTTVVVPCYGHAEFLPFAVQSLLEQTLPHFDTVLIDDCSPDGTGRLLPQLAARLRDRGRVSVVVHETNRGQAASLNAGFSLATTPLVSVLNDDDWLTPGALATLLETYGREGDVALVGSHAQWFTGPGRPPAQLVPGPPRVRRFAPTDMPALRVPNDLNFTHSGMTVSRAVWATVGGYRAERSARVVPFSDRDFQLRVAALYPVARVDDALVWWRADSSVDAGVNS